MEHIAPIVFDLLSWVRQYPLLMRNYLRTLVDDQGKRMELRGKVSEKTGAEYRERKLAKAIANIRLSSPEFSAADNLSRDGLYDQARTNPDSFNSREMVEDYNL